MSEHDIDPRIIAWLGEVREGLGEGLRREAPNLHLQHTRPIDTADLNSAICSHLEWRDKLEELFAGNDAGRIEPEFVGRSDMCTLGRWIAGEGESKLGDVESFRRLKIAHREFHAAVGEAVRVARQGEPTRARTMLNEQAYLEASWRVVDAISGLAAELAKPT